MYRSWDRNPSLGVKAQTFTLLGMDGFKRLNEPSISWYIIFHVLSVSVSEEPEENLVRPFSSDCFCKRSRGNAEGICFLKPCRDVLMGGKLVLSLREGAMLPTGCIPV